MGPINQFNEYDKLGSALNKKKDPFDFDFNDEFGMNKKQDLNEPKYDALGFPIGLHKRAPIEEKQPNKPIKSGILSKKNALPITNQNGPPPPNENSKTIKALPGKKKSVLSSVSPPPPKRISPPIPNNIGAKPQKPPRQVLKKDAKATSSSSKNTKKKKIPNDDKDTFLAQNEYENEYNFYDSLYDDSDFNDYYVPNEAVHGSLTGYYDDLSDPLLIVSGLTIFCLIACCLFAISIGIGFGCFMFGRFKRKQIVFDDDENDNDEIV